MKIGTFLTQQFVDTFKAQARSHRQALSDARVQGLQLECLPSGRVRWRLRYTSVNRRVRKSVTLGDGHVLSLADARSLAERELRKVALGLDPLQEKAASKTVPTFGRFVDEQYVPYIKTYKRSWDIDVSLLKNHLLPRFSNRYLDEIQRQDIVNVHQERLAMGAAPGSANRLVVLMRYIFNLAIRWDVPGVKVNPTKGVHLMEENNKRERYLSVEEAQRLYAAVSGSINPVLRYIVSMLILTGARKREVLDARWADFDIERRIWRIPMSKSGKARHVPLSDGALAVLKSLPVLPGVSWAFANPRTGRPYVSIFFAWDTARRKAGLGEVRVHDLRHSFASLLINSGRTLYEVQQILGHTQIKTTQRYAHLSQETLLDAANAASRAVGDVMQL